MWEQKKKEETKKILTEQEKELRNEWIMERIEHLDIMRWVDDCGIRYINNEITNINNSVEGEDRFSFLRERPFKLKKHEYIVAFVDVMDEIKEKKKKFNAEKEGLLKEMKISGVVSI